MATRQTLAVTLTAPLFLLLTLTGCGDNTSVADPPVSPAPTGSTAPSPPKRESPEHFIRRWAAVEKQMENTGDTTNYVGLSRGCEPCQVLARTVGHYYARGGYIRWDGWRIRSIRPYRVGAGRRAFAVSSISAPTRYKVSATSDEARLNGGQITYALTLRPARLSFEVTAKVQLGQ